MSLTFYVQLLYVEVPKEQKDTDDLTVFFSYLGFERIKAACKKLMKMSPDLYLI